LRNITKSANPSGRIPADVLWSLGLILHADSWIRAKSFAPRMAEIPAGISHWVKALNTVLENMQSRVNDCHVTKPRDIFVLEKEFQHAPSVSMVTMQ
jgi:hypothetical protein